MTNNIVNYNSKYYKRLGYIANICEDNYKNDIYAAIPDKKIERDHIDSGYIYNNFDNRRKNPILQLLKSIIGCSVHGMMSLYLLESLITLSIAIPNIINIWVI